MTPTESSMPTVPDPSSKPSVPPSSKPSRDCLDVPASCGNGGMWSPYTCECMCLFPYCPDDLNGRCSKTTGCPIDYHEKLFRGCPYGCPWFKYGSSCTSGEEVPQETTAIYRTKDVCCSSEFPADTSGCLRRTSGFSQLKFNGQFRIVGLTCPNSGSAIAAAAGDIAKSAFSVICSTVPNLSCGIGDKIVINKFCGRNVNIEAHYFSSNRRRYLLSGNDIVEFTLILNAVSEADLRQTDAILNKYFQGSNLANLLAAILNEIVTSTAVPNLQSINAIYYNFVNSFINGLGLYYPAWGVKETCLNDGKQKEYMNQNPEGWLYTTLEACCTRYYSWDVIGCQQVHAEATLVSSSGSVPAFLDPTSDLFYPAWGLSDTCVNDGNAPAYMKKQSDLWMYGKHYI